MYQYYTEHREVDSMVLKHVNDLIHISGSLRFKVQLGMSKVFKVGKPSYQILPSYNAWKECKSLLWWWW